jgi:plasmid stabilization system protein ParE
MTLPVIYAPQALIEIEDIANYLAHAQSAALGLRFLKSVEHTCAGLADMPEIAGRYESDNPRLADLRVWPVQGFPNHLVFYRIREASLQIVHVMHGARDLENLL